MRPAQRDPHRAGCNPWNLEADAIEGVETICIVLDDFQGIRTLPDNACRAAERLLQRSRSLPPKRGPFLDQRTMISPGLSPNRVSSTATITG